MANMLDGKAAFQTVWLVGLLTGWLSGCLAFWLLGLLNGWISGWLAFWLVELLACWPFGRLAFWLLNLLAGWPSGWLAFWPYGRLVGWPFGWFSFLLVGRMAFWLMAFWMICLLFGLHACWPSASRLALWLVGIRLDGHLATWSFGWLAILAGRSSVSRPKNTPNTARIKYISRQSHGKSCKN